MSSAATFLKGSSKAARSPFPGASCCAKSRAGPGQLPSGLATGRCLRGFNAYCVPGKPPGLSRSWCRLRRPDQEGLGKIVPVEHLSGAWEESERERERETDPQHPPKASEKLTRPRCPDRAARGFSKARRETKKGFLHWMGSPSPNTFCGSGCGRVSIAPRVKSGTCTVFLPRPVHAAQGCRGPIPQKVRVVCVQYSALELAVVV